MDIFIKRIVFLLLFFVGSNSVLAATNQPTVNLTVSNTEAKKGDVVTIGVTVNNGDTKELQDTVLALDLPVDSGLSFISSSHPIEWTSDSRPLWRLGIVGPGMTDQLSLTIRLNSDFAGTGLEAQALVTGSLNGEEQSIYSNNVGVSLIADEIKKEETKENDLTAKADTKDEKNTVDGDKVDGLVATGAKKIDVESLAGIADMSKYDNVNRWDGRFLVVGVVAFVLVLVVGLLAFFMGRKSK